MNRETARQEAHRLLESAQRLSADQAIDFLNATVAHNYRLLSDDPVIKAEGPWLHTARGRTIFDGVSAYSAANLGHGHPLIKETLKGFLDAGYPTVLGRFMPDPWLALFARKLTHMTGFDMFLPANGGVEAPEAAIKLARRFAHREKGVSAPEIIYADHCFHGRTLTVTQMFDEEDQTARAGFGPFAPGFVRVPFDDVRAIERALTPNTAAVFLEPIQGEGGINIPRPGYLSAVRALCREHNVLAIWDEIQTGFGRTGRLFAWEHEGEKARPDVLCVGKSASGGFAPVSGILASRRLMDHFEPGSHGSTFGGSPMAGVLGLAALTAIELERLPEQAAEKGAYALARLREVARKAPRIKEVRGMGLMLGIELNRNGPDGHEFTRRLLELGAIVKDTHHWVLRFTPPLVATRDELDFVLGLIEQVFTEKSRLNAGGAFARA
ncbi:aspartate aminotransferase family protein [bacterium]|nr:MAG: aspartate aminotransferase family protein [bacterium]RIK61666.1 MAG: ornithine--oxo-acid transaminase [Planctomycetota bacterium]